MFSHSMVHMNLLARCLVVDQFNPGAHRHVQPARRTTLQLQMVNY